MVPEPTDNFSKNNGMAKGPKRGVAFRQDLESFRANKGILPSKVPTSKNASGLLALYRTGHPVEHGN